MERACDQAAGDEREARPARRKRTAEHWLVLALALLALVALILLGTLIEPDPRGFGTHERLGLPPCRPMQLWNVPCPGCGVTTSISLLMHGELLASLRNQPFGLIAALLTPVFALWALVQHLRGRDLGRALGELRPGWWGLALCLLLGAAWIWKLALVRGWIG